MREFGFANIMQVPASRKVVLNIGMGEATQNAIARRRVGAARDHHGQKPVTRAPKVDPRTSRSARKNPIGLMVTLRGDRMWEFLDRLLNAALPRIRDFRGVSRYAFDGRGNFSLGVREQIIFPEIEYDKVDRVRGFQINIITNADSDEEGARLLELLGMPYSRS
jgi:large subunit ribosomal protein L5